MHEKDLRSIEPKIGESDIDESYIRRCDPVVLRTLLIDCTLTHLNRGEPVNIKWATDDYSRQFEGKPGYGREDPISPDAISTDRMIDLKVVTPRVKKRREEQRRRVTEKAEVFTPSWICNEQNNLVDEAWFGRKENLFNVPNPEYKTGLDFEAECPQLRWNDGLAIALSYMKEVEGWGGGVARYFTDWTAAGLPRPKLVETPGFFKVVFDRKKKANEPVNEPVNEPINEPVNEPIKSVVFRVVRKSPGISRQVLMRVVGKSRATMTRILSELVEQGLIKHRGSKKTGGYFPIASAHKEKK